MKHWKQITVLVLLVVVLISPMIKSTSEPPDYHLKFSGGHSYHYTMILPNTYRCTPEGQSDSFSGKRVTIGEHPAPRDYKVRGHYTYKFYGNWYWNERWSRPYISLQGCTPSLYKVYPEDPYNSSGDFEIPAGGVATLTYHAGHYISRFLGFLGITNEWGINGVCTIDLYFDTENPDPPQNVKLNGDFVTKITTGGTVNLSWEAPNDNPLIPTAKYEASGIRGYKILDGFNGGERNITPKDPDSEFTTVLNHNLTLEGEGEHPITIIAYDKEGNASLPVTVIVWVDQTPPTGNLNIKNNNGYTSQTTATMKITNLSDGLYDADPAEISGFAAVCFSNDNVTYSDWVPRGDSSNFEYGWPLSAGDGPKTVYMKLKDQAGNISENPVAATVTLDTTPPDGSLSINNEAMSASSQQVILNLAAQDDLSGVAGMMFSNDGVNYTITENYAAFKPWILSRAGGSAKTVSVKFTDIAGNTSLPFTDQIDYEANPVYTGITPVMELTSNEQWSGTHTINGQVVVLPGVILTIDPGTTVTIDGPSDCDPFKNGIIVEGTLHVGSGATFNVQSPKPGWMGIIVTGNANFTGANINMAERGIAILSGANVTVNNCVFTQNMTGIHVYANHPTISCCTFQGNTYGIKEDEIGPERPAVNGCTFISNWVAYYHDQLTKITMAQLNGIPGNGENQ